MSRYEVTKFIYGTSSIKLPECFMINSWSREAWNKESNWLGYVAVATDECKELLGRRDIVVAWRGTIQLYEWANDFDFPLESAISVLPRADPSDPPRIASVVGCLFIQPLIHAHVLTKPVHENRSLKKKKHVSY